MSDKAREFLEDFDPQIKEIGHNNYFYSPKQVIQRMESYAIEYHQKEMERKLGEAQMESEKISNTWFRKGDQKNGFNTGVHWLLSHLKEQIKSKD